jgi:signal transduction histidine kinase
MENLLTNAGHHTPPDTPIHLSASLSLDSELEIHIRDEGPGLEDPARVFERFQRGCTSRPGGLGLGLSIVRGLIRGLGGTVEATILPEARSSFSEFPSALHNKFPKIYESYSCDR